MLNRRFLVEGAALVLLAVLCAAGSNLLAGKERRLAVVQSYPNAMEVPAPRAAAPSAAPAPAPAPQVSATPAPAEPAAQITPPAAPSGRPEKSAPPAPVPQPARPAPKGPAEPSPAPRSGRLGEAEMLARFPPHHQPYREVTGADVLVLQAAGALVLDARRTKVYEEGHIAGARPFSVWEADVKEKIEALVGEGRNQSLPVVVYCSGGDCEDSHMLAQQLFGAGFENLLVYRDGWPDWLLRGGPRSSGARP